MKSDFHIHTKRCKHAEGEMRDYIEKAMELQMSEIAFTDHIPLPDNFDLAHRMSYKELENYMNEIIKVRSQYPDIKIYSGIEADYYEGFEEYLDQTFRRFDFDVIIMSVHFIKSWPKNNWVFSYYFPDKPMQKIYSEYLQAMNKGIDTGLFDIVGHLDLIKDENVSILESNRSEVHGVLKNIQKHAMTIEINTSGLRKDIAETYPNLNLLPLIENYKISVIFGSDAHRPEQVGFQFDTVEKFFSQYPDIKFITPTERSPI